MRHNYNLVLVFAWIYCAANENKITLIPAYSYLPLNLKY